MSRTLTASDRTRLIKMASAMPVGSPERKAILAGLSKSASFAWPSVRRDIERELKQHPAFISVWDEMADENVFALLVEYAEDDIGYEGGFRVEVYDQNGDLITEEAAPRGERTNLRPYVKDAQKDWNDAYRSASGRMAGFQSKGLSKSAGLPKSPSDAWDTYVGSEGVSDFMDGEDDAEAAVAAYAKGHDFFSDLSKSDAEKVKGMLVKYIEQNHKKAGFQSKGLKPSRKAAASDIPTLISANGGEKVVMPANGTDFKLREVQKMVGGYVEVVRLRDGRIMLVDEEGLLKGLPLNRAASRMAGRPIVGEALVMPDDMFR
jgi:hypothetical protein